MGKVPKKSSKKRNEPLGKKILKYAGATVLGVILLGAIILAVTAFISGTLYVHQRIADVEVQRIEKDQIDFGGDQDVVAFAVVEVLGRKMRIPLTSEDLAEVTEGTGLRVTFTYSPMTQKMELDEWKLTPPPEDEEPVTTP